MLHGEDMMQDFNRKLYDKHWVLWHFLIVLLISVLVYFFFFFTQFDINKLLKLVSLDTISISAEIAGFVFAGMSIFISLDGNAKMKNIKSIGKDNIIYNILILTIVLFLVSLLLMMMSINVFNACNLTNLQSTIKTIVEWISIASLLSGFVFFFSGLRLIYWVFKK